MIFFFLFVLSIYFDVCVFFPLGLALAALYMWFKIRNLMWFYNATNNRCRNEKRICPVEFERFNRIYTTATTTTTVKKSEDFQGKKSACELNSLNRRTSEKDCVSEKPTQKKKKKKWQTEEMWWKIVELWKPQAYTHTQSSYKYPFGFSFHLLSATITILTLVDGFCLKKNANRWNQTCSTSETHKVHHWQLFTIWTTTIRACEQRKWNLFCVTLIQAKMKRFFLL